MLSVAPSLMPEATIPSQSSCVLKTERTVTLVLP